MPYLLAGYGLPTKAILIVIGYVTRNALTGRIRTRPTSALTRRLVIPVLTSILLLSGCTSMSHIPEIHNFADRSQEYPVGIVTASFTPEVVMDPVLRAKFYGAAEGALHGVLECGSASAGTGTFAGPAFVLCLPIGILLGGVTSGTSNESGKNMTAAERVLIERAGKIDTQSALVITVSRYLNSMDDRFNHVILTDVPGPDRPDDLKGYQPAKAGNTRTLLELSMLGFYFTGTGQEGTMPCLRMQARARKLNTQSGQLLDELDFSYRVACHTPSEWANEDGRYITEAIAQGYQHIAENIVDELFLIYKTTAPGHENIETPDVRPVPHLVLAPVYPPAPKIGIKWGNAFAFHKTRGGAQGFGGMQFSDVDTLEPELSWEKFPRTFDQLQTDSYSNVVYDLRIYDGTVSGLGTISPLHRIYEISGITEPRHQLPLSLKPCGWYFWTVRARFRLNGINRATEWAGAYNILGGTIYPSFSRRHGPSLAHPWPAHFLYYPFRTPGFGDNASCWGN